MKISFVSEGSFRVSYGNQFSLKKYEQLLYVRNQLMQNDAITEAVVGYTTLTVYFNPFRLMYKDINSLIAPYLNGSVPTKREGNVLRVPVCYEGGYAPDLQAVADYHSIDKKEVIRLHSHKRYQVLFLGFAPGFPFLTEVDTKIATPRKSNPRREVPGGSVGIAGKQTGIYPSSSPGGWQIIGRTPIHLLPMKEDQPTFFQPGDVIKFYPISAQEFRRIQKSDNM